MITVRIDVLKITKSRLYKGEKGTYLDCVLIPTPNSEHADYMVVEQISKEERQAGVKGVILGNAKNLNRTQSHESIPPDDFQTPPAKLEEQTDDLPF